MWQQNYNIIFNFEATQMGSAFKLRQTRLTAALYNERQTLTWNRAPLFFWACEGEEASSPLLSFDFFSFFSFFFFGGGRLSGRPFPVRR
jgi:hypothetical protein